jgi:hypothetical protein
VVLERSNFAVLKATLTLLAVSLVLAGPSPSTAQETDEPRAAAKPRLTRSQLWRTRPARLEGPLRVENISDEEVREIQGVMREHFPGAIVNIGGVTTGCPCGDGAGCESQVWVVAHQVSRSDGLMLSRIDDQWVIGPLQQWWRRYDQLSSLRIEALGSGEPDRLETARNFLQQRNQLEDEFPACEISPGPPTQTAPRQ